MTTVARSDDRDAWRAIGERLRPFVARRVASPSDADDVLQDVFVRIAGGAPLRDEERFTSWLFAVARSALAEHGRQRARHPNAEAKLDEPEFSEDAPDTLRDELTTCVARFVTRLPDDYREAITLVELEGVSQSQAAEMLGLSRSGMKSRVQRGRALLRGMFEQACALELDGRRKVLECEPRSDDPCAQPRSCAPAGRSPGFRGDS